MAAHAVHAGPGLVIAIGIVLGGLAAVVHPAGAVGQGAAQQQGGRSAAAVAQDADALGVDAGADVFVGQQQIHGGRQFQSPVLELFPEEKMVHVLHAVAGMGGRGHHEAARRQGCRRIVEGKARPRRGMGEQDQRKAAGYGLAVAGAADGPGRVGQGARCAHGRIPDVDVHADAAFLLPEAQSAETGIVAVIGQGRDGDEQAEQGHDDGGTDRHGTSRDRKRGGGVPAAGAGPL